MIELHLIGYTADAERLVLDLDLDGEGRYAVEVDADLLATIEELRQLRIREGLPIDARPDTDDVVSPSAVTPPAVAAPTPAALDDTGEIEPVVVTDADADTSTDEAPGATRHEHRPSSSAVPHAQLSPAEIQAQLRAGRSVRAVAAEAGTDRAWIERWLPPIVAERERVLAEARRRRLDVPRARALGPTVDRALTERGVAEEDRTWSASRRADGRWRVSVRFEERDRTRTATWLMDPAAERVQAASPLAEELAGPGKRPTRRR
ncbi:MAG: septation protein SepH [Nitriliruptor sp.]